MSKPIPHSRPTLGRAEVKAAAKAVRSGHVAAGERTRRFEEAVAGSVDMGDAVATSSGTAALYVALKALGVRPGHDVLIPSFVCAAVLHAVRATGAEPIVCDVGENYNIAPDDVKAKLTPQTAAIVVPHLFGTPAPIREVQGLGPPVVEDCAQALGATLDGAPCGSFGSVSVFSFYATKIICTGEGGMLASWSTTLVARARNLIQYETPDPSGSMHRFNLKFNDIAAAVGRVQLPRLPEFVRRRSEIAALYDEMLGAVPGIERRTPPPGSTHYRYIIEVDDPEHLIARLDRLGIAAPRPVPVPLHRIVRKGDCPNADRAWERAVSLPIYPTLSSREARRVAEAVITCLP